MDTETKLGLLRFSIQTNRFILPISGILSITGIINLMAGETILGFGRGTQGIGIIEPISITIAGVLFVVSGLSYIYSDLVFDDETLLNVLQLLEKAFFIINCGLSIVAMTISNYILGLESIVTLLVTLYSVVYLTSLLIMILSLHRKKLDSLFTFLVNEQETKRSLKAFIKSKKTKNSLEDKLSDLNSLYEKKLITEKEFKEKRKDLIDSI